MLSLLLIFIEITLILTQNTLPIRFGLLQLQMGASSQGTFKIVFKEKLPAANYSQMIAVSYVTDFDIEKGIFISSSCPNQTETEMGCSIYSQNPNKNNIVYISFIASSIPTWTVGTYQEEYSFDGSGTFQKVVKAQPNIDPSLLRQIDTRNFHPYIVVAGISSFDNDFDLTISQNAVDPFSFQISFLVSIEQAHNTTASITYGYILYDFLQYNLISSFKIPLIQDSIPQKIIYTIEGLASKKTQGRSSTPSVMSVQPSPRKLQIIRPLQSTQLRTLDPASIQPVTTKNSRITMRSASSSAASIISPKIDPLKPPVQPRPSLASQLLRNGNFSNLKIRFVNYDPTIINGIRASDGIIQTYQNIPTNPRIKSSTSKAGTVAGTNSQLFNSLFITNGLTILTQTDLSQTYYTEIIAVSDIPPMSRAPLSSSSIYYPTTIANRADNLICVKGVKVCTFRNVDLLQRKAVPFCLICPQGSYADIKAKICVGFPIIRYYSNVYDTIK